MLESFNLLCSKYIYMYFIKYLRDYTSLILDAEKAYLVKHETFNLKQKVWEDFAFGSKH